MTSPRQTQSHLRSLFAQRGIVPRHRYGQNFLIDINIHDLIVRTAQLEPGDVVLEIGSGTGALTSLMAASGVVVCAVEIDEVLAKLTVEATKGLANVHLLRADALAGKNRISPGVLSLVTSALANTQENRLKLVANLPYSVASPVISNLLVHDELLPTLMVVTIQQEVANRLVAEPATASYGALSVLTQALSNVEVVRHLPPSVFWPRPKVESAIVRLEAVADKRAAVDDLPWFHSVVRRIFLHRRKNLRSVVHSLWPDSLQKGQVDELLGDIGLMGQVRAEALNVSEFIALAQALKQRVGPDTSIHPTQPHTGRS